MKRGPVGPGREGPDRWAVRLVTWVLPAAARDGVVGDLHERYVARVARDGRPSARRWYWRQAAAFLARVPVRRVRLALSARLPTGRGDPGPHDGRSEPESRILVGTGVATDIRLAGRALRKRPGLTLTAATILALAVGANTTVFSVVNAILLERLPFPAPERLVMLWDTYPEQPRMGAVSPITLEHYRAWAERTDLFAAAGAWESSSPTIRQGDWPERIEGALVTSNLLQLLGARPALGRLFVAQDEASGAEPVVVLSHGLWVSRFGADPAVVGGTIDLDGKRTRVIGVTSEGFWFYDPYSSTRSLTGSNAEAARLWQPLRDGGFGGEADYPRYRVIARLRDGISVEGAAEAAAAVRRRLPPTSAGDGGELRLIPLTEQVVAEARPRLLGLSAAVSLVLLIACVNLISLLLVHVESRRSEFAVRIALGAGRGRLTRQLVAESTLLALVGGLVGLLVSNVATSWLLDFVPRGLPLAYRVKFDAGVAAFGTGLAVFAGIIIGLVAAFRIDPRRLAGVVAMGPRTMASGRATRRVHGVLVTAEVALSLVLLIAATLLLRSLVSLSDTETGFDARGVLTFEASMTPGAGRTAPSDYFAQLESRLAELPGVVAIGGTSALPFSRWAQSARVEVDRGEAGDAASGDAGPPVDYRVVSPGYFDAIGLRLRSGRAFGEADRAGAPPVAIVNEAFVAEWLDADPDPVGRIVTVAFRERAPHTIVGVVANVKHHRLFEEQRPILYAPARQSELPYQRFAVRLSTSDPSSFVDPVRRIGAEIDAAQPLQNFISFEALVAQSIEDEVFYTRVVVAFAVTALLLTLVGIYGVVSFTTRQRDREVGIRMALGAESGRVQRLVLVQGLAPVGIGLALGWLGSLASTGLLSGLLHGLPARDAASYFAATAAFAIVAAAACLIPARRAARLDPVRVLRGE